MNGPTVYFQSEGCQFKIHLDKLPVATLPKIKKLFRYIQSEKWNNQVASDAVEAFLPKQIAKSRKVWKQAGITYQNGYRLASNKRSKEGRTIEAQNNKLENAVKSAWKTYRKWEHIEEIWNEVKGDQ